MIDLAAQPEQLELAARLRAFVARRVPPADVDDVVQDVYLRVLRRLPTLRDDERFGPWVFRVTRSAIAEFRRQRRRHPLGEHETEPVAPAEEGPDAEQELARHMAPFVAALPSPYREALTLTELEGLTQREAADMLGLSASGMKSRVQRGRARLRELFEACCEIVLDVRGHVLSCEPRPDAAIPEGCCPGGGCSKPTYPP